MIETFNRIPEMKDACNQARALREYYLNDPHRPGYHFVVPEGVHGPVDPNGALFWNGRYHLFYIYQENDAHFWGHVSSVDLLHWRHHVPGLSPGGTDEGIFSGGAFVDKNGVPTISYWGLGQPDGVCLATSTDPQLDHWVKNPANPVIAATMTGLTETEIDGKSMVYGAADPSQIWEKDGHYYMLTGNLLVLNEFFHARKQSEYQGDTLYLFRSDDLTHWTYLHRFYESRREWTRDFEDNMCPDFFPLPTSAEGGTLSDKHMILFISHTLGCQYYIGTYADDHFLPEQHGRMTWIDNDYFAPESLSDPAGRRIMWTWLFDRRDRETVDASGWSGELSLPRIVWLGDDGTLRMQPAQELQTLRHNPVTAADVTLAAGQGIPLPTIQGNSLEIAVTLHPAAGGVCGVRMCCSPDGQERTTLTYDDTAGTLSLDTRESSLGEGPKAVESAPFQLAAGEALELRVFIDKSVIEVYANNRQAVVRRIYPSLPTSTGVSLFAQTGAAKATNIQAWEIMPCNPY